MLKVHRMQTTSPSLTRSAHVWCLAAALWFALSPVLKVLQAHLAGKPIEIVVCTGSGMKTVLVPVDAAATGATTHETLKHCSNTPLAILASAFDAPQNLAYASPQAQGIRPSADVPHLARDWVLNGWPPPARAPPTPA